MLRLANTKALLARRLRLYRSGLSTPQAWHTGSGLYGVRTILRWHQGRTRALYGQGLWNAVVVDAMQIISVGAQAPFVASPLPLMFDCHIGEHQDAGMMGQFITS